LSVETATAAASMAIDRPEAIDAALVRAAAQRRMAAGGYFASRCKERMALGGK